MNFLNILKVVNLHKKFYHFLWILLYFQNHFVFFVYQFYLNFQDVPHVPCRASRIEALYCACSITLCVQHYIVRVAPERSLVLALNLNRHFSGYHMLIFS